MSGERKYALIKLARGDYLLPSNDGRTVWRLATYVDGPSAGLAIPGNRTFWGVWRWTGEHDAIDPDDWDQWSMDATLCRTRAEAISEALRLR